MRIVLTLLLLSVAVASVPAADPAAPDDAAVDALIATAIGRDTEAATEASRKLVKLGPFAVPALTQGLWADSATRRACISLLGAIGADARSAAPSLVRFLNHEDAEVRASAVRALGSLGAHSTVPALTKLLEDKSAAVRLSAAEALIHLAASAEVILPVLTKALKSDQPEESYAAARLFGELGPEAAPALATLNNQVPGADPILTALLADALGRVGPGAKDAIPALKTKVTEDKNPALYRVQAALAMWRINRDPDAVTFLRAALDKKSRLAPHAPLWRIDQSKETEDALAEQLKAEDAEEALRAARVLGARSKDTLPTLLRLLKVEEPTARLLVVPLLGEYGPEAKDALEQLQEIASGRKPGRHFDAAVAIYRIAPTPKTAQVITEFLEDKNLRLEAIEVLKQLRPTNQAVVIELLAALDISDDQVKLAAAVALWRIEKHAQALPSAIKRLRSTDPKVRETAAADIGAEFGADAKPAVPELVKRLFDRFASVRSTSAEALGRIGPGANEATKPLIALLDGDEPAFVQSAACEALGLIQPTDKDDALAVLRKKLEHPDALVRAHAALALVRVAGDKSGEQEAVHGLTWRTHAVRITAAETVWRMNKDARAVPLLVRALEEANLEGTVFENERYMAARALGRIGPDAKEAVPELVKLIDHRDYALATAARTALKAVDPDAAKKAGVK